MSAIYIPGFVTSNSYVTHKNSMAERYPELDAAPSADQLFRGLWDKLDWERRADAPRREYWTNVYDQPYSYGRGAGLRTYEARPITSEILLVSESLNRDPRVNTFFEGCFLNGYDNAKDWLGWHEDDDPGIDHSKPIAIVTLYGNEGVDRPRSIQFREKLGLNSEGKMTYGEVLDLPLEHGSLCLMPAGFQSTHQHRIPKAGFEARSRISLTFRSLL